LADHRTGEACRAAMAGRFPARARLAGGEEWLEEVEETKPHLWVPGIGVGAACGGVPAEEQRRRRVGRRSDEGLGAWPGW
jgi:hypothetical protein